MSSVIDTLQVVFTAETGALTAQLSRIGGQLASLGSIAAAANAGIRNLAGALEFDLDALAGGAFSAGAQLGAAFASGIISANGSVAQAAAYISASAMAALKGSYTAGGSVAVSGMDSTAISGASGGSGSLLNQNKEVTIPINVDGVKLGEACIKALDKVAGMTGRARLSI